MRKIRIFEIGGNSGAIDLSAFRGQYDAVSGGAEKRRRAPRVESTAETGAGSTQLNPTARLQMINLARDLDRNFSSTGFIDQLVVNVCGPDFKVAIKQDSEAARKAEEWFNEVYALNCDFRGDRHLSDFNSLLFRSMLIDGDVGLAFDSDLTDSGRLIAYAADQICDPDKLPEGVTATNDGVLLDQFGREVGYFTTSKIGRTKELLEDGFVWKRDPLDSDASNFRLLRKKMRLNQYRGGSSLAAAIADLLDCYEMRSKVLQSAKVTSSFAGVVKRKPASEGPAYTDPRYDPNAMQHTPEVCAGGGDADGSPSGELKNYDNLEALTGGNFEYLEEGDEVEMLDPGSRPQLNSEEFMRYVVKSAAASLGLPECYATLEVASSYTAFRGQLQLAWRTIEVYQKWFERSVQNWEAVRAIRWAIRHNVIPKLADGWERALVWRHPMVLSVDPEKEQRAINASLKNGSASLQSHLGPAWRSVLKDQQEEAQAYHDAGRLYPAETDNNGMKAEGPEEGEEQKDV